MNNKFSYNEAFERSKEYFGGEELPAKVFLDKYALRNEEGDILEDTPEKMFDRLSNEIYKIEKNKFKKPLSIEEIKEYIKDFKRIVPQGSPMYGIGNNTQYVSTSNCFVVDSPEDSYGGILKTDEEIVQISKRRGGVGLDISKLRPRGTRTTNAARTSTGIVSFLERFSHSIREVGQNGRRGALLVSLSVHHPDILSFITSKRDITKITGANISVRLSDEFLLAVENNKEYEQRWPVDSKNPTISKKVEAKEVWDKIIEMAWACVDYNTEIDVFKDSELKKYKIGDFYNEFHNNKHRHRYEIMSLNLKTLKKEKKEIIKSQEYFNDKKTYNIQIGSGDLIVTEDHIFYKLSKDGNITPTPIKEIEIGDKLLFSKTKEFGSLKNINLIEIIDHFCDNGYSLCGEEIEKILNDEKVKILLGKYSNGWYKATYYKDSGCLPIRDYIKIKDKINLSLDGLFLKLSRKEEKTPIKMELNEHFCSFLGLWLSEGSYNSGGNIRFHIHKDEFSSYVNMFDFISDAFCCNYSYKHYNNYCCVDFNSSILKRLITGLNLKSYLCDKKIPDFIFSTTKENISAFLKGMFSGDGTVGKKGRISFSQSNKKIIEDTQKLLLKFGIHCSIQLSTKKGFKKIQGKQCKIKDNYRLHIYSQFNNIFKKDIGFFQKNKQNRIINNLDSIAFGIPINLNYNKIYKEMGSYHRDYIKNSSIKNHPNLMEDKKVKKFIDGDFYYLKLNRKEEIKNIETVYDITVKDNHTFILSNGIVLSNSAEPGLLFWDNIIIESPADCYSDEGFKSLTTNPCGEIVLCAYDSCRLLSLNLFYYVKNPFTKDSYFDYDLLKKDAKIAQRIQDDIIDIEINALSNIINKIKNDPEEKEIKEREIKLWEKIMGNGKKGRRTGTGITALGDTIAALGMKYGSEESIEEIDKIYRTLKLGCYESSIEMAKEIGAFPIWDKNKEKNNPFLLRIKDEDENLYNNMLKYGRRNISCLTTAPAGSISLLTQTTSGIEPCFQISYKRRKKINENDGEVRVDFIDKNGDKWQEFEVLHPKVSLWSKINEETDIKKSPWFNACAEDINWINRVKIQCVANKHVDHSISSTCNLPEDVSIEEVKKIYETAWKNGAKGITVYRKNSRTGVLIDSVKKEEKETIKKTNAPKRPPTLLCDIYHTTSKGEQYFVLVGLLNNEPYEVFAGKNGNIKKTLKQGNIKKIKRGKYSLLEENGEVVVDDISIHINDEQEAITRLISSNLRHGCDVGFVTHQLEKTKGDLLSFSKALSRCLKKYIPNDAKIHGENCEECGGELIRAEGCVKCISCSWSRCG